MIRRPLFTLFLWLGVVMTGLSGVAAPVQSGSGQKSAAAPPATSAGAAAPGAKPQAASSDFCLRLLPGWSVRQEGAATFLVAPASAQTEPTAFRLELDVLHVTLKENAPLPHEALLEQIKARLGQFLRDISEDADARQIFTTPDAAGVIYRLRGFRRRTGKAMLGLVYVLIGENGARTALLTPLEEDPPTLAFRADLDAQMHTLRFLSGGHLTDAPLQEFSGRLMPTANRFYLWLRERGDAEAVWTTTSPQGEEISARLAGSYALRGQRLRIVLLRTGGENPFMARLLELDLQSGAGGKLEGTAHLDDTQRVPITDLQRVSAKFAQGSP
jgi:hypothetical protein